MNGVLQLNKEQKQKNETKQKTKTKQINKRLQENNSDMGAWAKLLTMLFCFQCLFSTPGCSPLKDL